jgi:sterol desaturase/sphingolipid hydroxylase (fatty acid hydroxylase superfamily)
MHQNDDQHFLNQKISEFQDAMARYHGRQIFHNIELLVASLVMILQFLTTINLLIHPPHLSPLDWAVTLMISYLLADFISGLAHLVGDNLTHYTSFFGPFIAAFHLHHQHMKYRERDLLAIYFYESGTKFWLVIYLLVLLIIQYHFSTPSTLQVCLVSIGILSSVAEVSHYLCHNAEPRHRVVTFLQRNRILLSKNHHRKHHMQDNINYAFLNGVTDPLINVISKRFFSGYQTHSDLHAASYIGPQSNNRTP